MQNFIPRLIVSRVRALGEIKCYLLLITSILNLQLASLVNSFVVLFLDLVFKFMVFELSIHQLSFCLSGLKVIQIVNSIKILDIEDLINEFLVIDLLTLIFPANL